ncbi:hypothetical protein [Leptospira santarosai]|uniref:Uncharacterized protein n=2 Tax=Leptospira santarosai TaxID=28183 RepID=M6JFY1_9LEPT|nr:hypothetical protein [Leptospira santarosai]EMN20864.1 hypothetical protein LEP1GSC063_3197 [Leptospira santarosai serovar Arenal str. MAVJ 401]KXZ31517.1 hypothetical protein AYB33_00810 [Leptospira santarosai]
MNIFPGTEIFYEKDQIIQKMLTAAPINLKSLHKWNRLDAIPYKALEKFEDYYLLYIHPIHTYKYRLFLTNQKDLIPFLKVRINPDRLEGVDLILSSLDFSEYIICNHDGEIYTL